MAAFLAALLILLVAVVALVKHARDAKKRRLAYRAVAEGMGWNYTERDTELVGPYRQLPVFRDGHFALNVLRGDFGSRPAAIFEYTQGQGKSAIAQTIVHLQSAAVDLPTVELRPEVKFADQVFKAFGYQDIEFSHRPEFTRRFVLRGPDETAIRARFTDDVVDAIEAIPRVCLQASGPHLFLYRMGEVVMPDALPELLSHANDLLRTFEGELASSGIHVSPPPLST